MKRTLKVLLIVVVVLIALIALTPTILSTGLGRSLAEDQIESELGRDVNIKRLDVGWLDGIRIEGLEIAEREDFGSTPFVRMGELRIPGSLPRLAGWGDRPTEVHVTGPEVSIIRLADDRLSISDLLEPDEEEPDEDDEEPGAAEAAAALAAGRVMQLALDGGRVHISDARTGTDTVLEDFRATANYDRGVVTVPEAEGRLNDGTILLTAEADLAQWPEPYSARLILADVKLSSDLSGLGLQVPLLYNPLGRTRGLLDLDVDLSGAGFSSEHLETTLTGTSRMVVRDLTVEGSPLIGMLLAALGQQRQLRFERLTADSRIADGRVITDSVRAPTRSGWTLVMSGSTGFDGTIDYQMRAAPPAGDNRPEWMPLVGELARFRLTGTLNDPTIRSGSGLGGAIEGIFRRDTESGDAESDETRQRIREGVRGLLEQFQER